MKSKYSDEDLMAFADKETTGEKAMDILGDLLKGDKESKILAKRIAVYVETRNDLINLLLQGEGKWESYGLG